MCVCVCVRLWRATPPVSPSVIIWCKYMHALACVYMCEHVCVQCPGVEGFSTDSWPPGGSLEKISKVEISLVCLFLRIPKDFPTKNCPEGF